MQLSRIRLSDKTSRFHPRHVVPQARETHETHGLVEVRGRIGPVPAASDLVLVAQPPAQPRRRVAVDRPIRFRSEEHTSELQSHHDLVCRLLLEKKKKIKKIK